MTHNPEDKLIEEEIQELSDSELNEVLEEEAPAEENWKEKYIRTLAEQENMRKRMQKEKQETLRYCYENCISEFLAPLDNLENALRFTDQASSEVKNWAMGFQMILTQFKEVLHNHGVVAFHSEGNTFDPHYHEAVEILETEEQAEGTILKEFTKGYKSASRTIRPARVKVAKRPAAQENSAETESGPLEETNENM